VCLLNELFASLIWAAYMAICIMIISSVFCIIKLRYGFIILGTAFFLVFLLQLVVVSFVIIGLMIDCSKNSSSVRSSFERNDLRRSKYDLLFWKSCPRLEIQAGQLFTIASKDFLLKTYGKIILETTAGLLLTF